MNEWTEVTCVPKLSLDTYKMRNEGVYWFVVIS